MAAIAAGVTLLVGGNTRRDRSREAVVDTGSVIIESTPPGATVTVDGESRGPTPLTLTLRTGVHRVEVAAGGISRPLELTVRAGTTSNQHVVFAVDERRGSLQVVSEPSGARVAIDNKPVGATPLTVTDLESGPHTVVLQNGPDSSRHRITIQPGATATISATLGSEAASGGFMRVVAPFEVELFERGSLIGSSKSERIMLPIGQHAVTVSNTTLGYQVNRTIQVSPGQTTTIRLQPPQARVDINAVPWAEVTIGGRSVGSTPLAAVQVPIGVQEVVFQHPQLGERRVTTTVTVAGPNRVSINMNQR